MTKRKRSFRQKEYAFMWLNSDIDVELFILRDFLDNISDLIVKETNKLRAEMRQQQKKFKKDRESLFAIDDYYSDGLARYGGAYKAIFHNTTFVAAVSLFEYLLKKICTFYYPEHNLTVDDIRANGHIATYRKYLEKVVKIDLSHLDDKWKVIEKYNSVRNAIVHDDSNINPKNKPNLSGQELYVFLSKSTHIEFEVTGSGKFGIADPKFIIEFIDLVEQYFEGVTGNMENQLHQEFKKLPKKTAIKKKKKAP